YEQSPFDTGHRAPPRSGCPPSPSMCIVTRSTAAPGWRRAALGVDEHDRPERKTRLVCPGMCPDDRAPNRWSADNKRLVELHLPPRPTVGGASPSRPRDRTFPRKCQDHVYLQTCGEVAERLKAAVC